MGRGLKPEVWVRARMTEHFLGARHGLGPVEILSPPTTYEVTVLLQGPVPVLPSLPRVLHSLWGDRGICR